MSDWHSPSRPYHVMPKVGAYFPYPYFTQRNLKSKHPAQKMYKLQGVAWLLHVIAVEITFLLLKNYAGIYF